MTSKNSVWLIASSTMISILGFTLISPLVITEMENSGRTGFEIGVMTATPFLMVLCMGPFIQRWSYRFGAGTLFYLAKIAVCLSFPILIFTRHYFWWLFVHLILGLGSSIFWPLSEAAIAKLAPPEKKGTFTGIYQTGIGLAFTVGPFIPSLFKNSFENFVWIGSVISALSIIPLLFFDWADINSGESPKGSFSFTLALKLAPALVIAAFMGGLFENGMNAVSILSGSAAGWANRPAMAIAGVIGAGSFFVQYPIGVLADRWGHKKTLSRALFILTLSLIALPIIFLNKNLIWPLALLWGGLGGALYTLAMIAIAQHFKDSMVLTMTTVMVSLYTFGGMMGPAIGGMAYDFSPRYGVATIFAVFSMIAYLFSRRTDKKIVYRH